MRALVCLAVCAVLCGAVLCCAVLCCAVLCCARQEQQVYAGRCVWKALDRAWQPLFLVLQHIIAQVLSVLSPQLDQERSTESCRLLGYQAAI